MTMKRLEGAGPFAVLVLLLGCRQPQETGYVPGLGELMSAQQMRHAKLWFAGENRNWRLASYEVDELREGFADVVKLHPMLENSHIPVSQLVPTIIGGPLNAVGAAVQAQDQPRFEGAYDKLTTACNSCHQAANFGFNVVKRPTEPPFSNQEFQVTGGPRPPL